MYCFRVKQTQGDAGSEHPRAGEEGAALTRRLMAEVSRLRNSKQPRWSAERLAEQMTGVGVPWTRNSVVNLESGRRAQIAVHELLALAWVLDVPNPLDLLAPADDTYTWVLPARREYTAVVRAWFAGEDRSAARVKAAAEEMAASAEVPDVTPELLERLLRAHVARLDESTSDGQG